MSKPKDPEVVEEMAAAGKMPEEAGEPEGGASGKKKGGKRKQAAKKQAEAEAAAADREDKAAEDASGAEGPPPGEDPAGADVAEDDARTAEDPDALREILVDEPVEEHAQRSPAATALMVLTGVIVVAVGTLWAAPRIAPHVPAGVGQYLMPGQLDTAGEIADLRQALADERSRAEELVGALGARVDAAEVAVEAAAGAPEAVAAAEGAAQSAAEVLELARAATAETQALAASLGGRLDEVEGGLAELRGSVDAVNTALAGGSAEGGPAPAELAAAVASLRSRIDSLAESAATRAEIAAAEERISDIGGRLDAIEESAAAAAGVQEQAIEAVASAIRQASLRTAVAELTSQVTGGQPYAASLAETAALAGNEAPAALAGSAETGLATASQLAATFGRHAQAAIKADVQARAGDGTGSQVLGWLRSQVTGRPVGEREGDSVAATTSRISARLGEGALADALAEAGTLPAHSQAAMEPWLGRLRARVEAEAALGDWLGQIGVNG